MAPSKYIRYTIMHTLQREERIGKYKQAYWSTSLENSVNITQVQKSVWNMFPSGQHTMMYPFMNCPDGQQLWQLSLCHGAILPVLPLHSVGFTIKEQCSAVIMHHYCYLCLRGG